MAPWKTFADDDVPDDFVLPPGDALRGQLLFKKHCAQCHAIEKGKPPATGTTLLGPHLYGVYGRTAGTNARSSLIDSSAAMRESGIVWNDITLMRYLKNPRHFTESPLAMNFRGMDDWQDRVDLIWFIKHVCEDTFDSLKKAASAQAFKTKLRHAPSTSDAKHSAA